MILCNMKRYHWFLKYNKIKNKALSVRKLARRQWICRRDRIWRRDVMEMIEKLNRSKRVYRSDKKKEKRQRLKEERAEREK